MLIAGEYVVNWLPGRGAGLDRSYPRLPAIGGQEPYKSFLVRSGLDTPARNKLDLAGLGRLTLNVQAVGYPALGEPVDGLLDRLRARRH
jgi:hypothetical protein